MNLISCEECGVLIDTRRIPKPQIYSEDDLSVMTSEAIWDGDDWVPAIKCPCCKAMIAYSTGDQ